MKVIAKKGTKCPKEGKPREYITDETEVPETTYYLRLIQDGSLLPVEKRRTVVVKRKSKSKER